jgi:hypothetical protein
MHFCSSLLATDNGGKIITGIAEETTDVIGDCIGKRSHLQMDQILKEFYTFRTGNSF